MYDFKTIEETARNKWKENHEEIEQAIHNIPERELFSFLEGPPTANAPPGLHHLEVRTYKDIVNKFRFMQGFSVPRKGGWDCHGLPVEVQVEKKLGLKSKKDVEEYGIGKFIEKCRQDVFSNIEDWSASTKELDYWIDLEHPYVTMDNNYIESVWWSLKELYKKGLLYEGYKVVPFCPRCGTPLSSHEVSQNYKDIKEDSVYIAFQLAEKKGEYILAWTTTPWTLPGNVALAVGPEIDYVKIKLSDGDKLILGKDKLDLIKGDYEILEELKGKDLVGLEYKPLYEIEELKNENSYKVISADFVTTEDGTGIVHTAVMYGEDDYKLGKEAGLPEVHTVGQDGKFLDISPEFIRGKYVKDAEKDIMDDLKKRHQLFKVEKITHSYPFCWRCDTQLLYYGVNSWFVDVPKVRDRLIELNKEINWYPEHIKSGRFGKWLEGAKEWSLSRFKFWGTPLPIWKCTKEGCSGEKSIGSIEEMKNEALEMPSSDSQKIDLHRPWVDKIKFKCDKCGGEMERVNDVIDCWYDSGSASFAQFHYPFENKETFEKRFPYDFIGEAIDQTRGWFYTLHVLATILFDKPAYKNVICAGHVVDEKGEKMSKSKGNVIKPREIIDKAGVDAVRLQFLTSDAGNQKRFSYNLMKERVLPFLRVLYNSYKYYTQLGDKSLSELKEEDKWILSRLNSSIKNVTENLEIYNLNKPFENLYNFVVNDLSKSYIKVTRGRGDNKKILKEILEKVSLLLAPLAPYLSEYIYSEVSDNYENSVHLSPWPVHNEDKIDRSLEGRFERTFTVIENGLSERDREGIGLRWPLKRAIVKGEKEFSEEINEIIKSELNVKSLEFREESEENIKVELDTEMNEELEAEGYAREVSRKVQAFRKKLGLDKNDKVKTYVFVDEDFKKTLDKKEDFLKERTNSQELIITTEEETKKENFKNMTNFNIKDKRGEIVIMTLKQ